MSGSVHSLSVTLMGMGACLGFARSMRQQGAIPSDTLVCRQGLHEFV